MRSKKESASRAPARKLGYAIHNSRLIGQPSAALGRCSGPQIDVIVVYKVDRLTRSRADFAKLVGRCRGPPASGH
jgi:hypothetical protein